MTEKLFPDSETFTKDRPLKITDEQKKAFLTQIAREIIKNRYSTDSLEEISEDMFNVVNFNDSGYEIAKDLDNDGQATYDIDSQFIEFLEGLSWRKDDILKGNVKAWVKAHNIRPSYNKGQQLTINIKLNHLKTFAAGEVVYINGVQPETATYLVDTDPKKNGGTVIPFERVETNCVISIPA